MLSLPRSIHYSFRPLSLPLRTDASSALAASRTDVGAIDGGLGGSEAETNVLVETGALAARLGGLDLGLGLETNVRLLEESTLALDSQLGGHFCDLSVVVESQRGLLSVVVVRDSVVGCEGRGPQCKFP